MLGSKEIVGGVRAEEGESFGVDLAGGEEEGWEGEGGVGEGDGAEMGGVDLVSDLTREIEEAGEGL